MNSKLICIEGNLGAGKTTLAKALSKKLECHLILETFLNNPFLADLYADKIESKFPAEVFFLMERKEQLATEKIAKQELTVSDYLIDKTEIFARINLLDKEKDLFQRIFHAVKAQTKTPDAIIYIEQTPKEALKNVKSRGRKLENNISLEYLTQLNKEYSTLFNSEIMELPVLKVSANNLRENLDDSIDKIIDFLASHQLLLSKNQVKIMI